MERPFIIMREAKPGYLDGKRREFAAGEVYQVDETLHKAFVVDLKIADEFDPKAGAVAPVPVEEPAAVVEHEAEPLAAGPPSPPKTGRRGRKGK